MTNPTHVCPSPQQLEGLLDEALGGQERQGVADHVAACAACQEALERLTGDEALACTSVSSRADLKSAPPVAGAAREFLDRLKHGPPPEEGPRPRGLPVSGPPAVVVPGYEILQELGRGGMGVVYQARQVSLDRLVTLKMILAGPHAAGKDLARFRQEAEAVARLRHPNIVQIYDIGASEGRPYLALEYVEDGSLVHRLRGDPQPVEPAVALVETLARAVHFAHQHHIVHRDLKPANILLCRKSEAAASDFEFRISDFSPKVTDFGLAKRLDEPSSKTHTGEVLGTPSYMAPEQAAGDGGRIGPATDTYALGAVLYELLTGRPPFKGATAVDTLVQVLHEEPLRPSRLRPGLPIDLETICLKCLEKDPPRRYASALALADDLHRFRKGRPILARPVGPLERCAKWVRHRPLTASLVTAILLLAVLGFAGVTWQWRGAAAARADAEHARDLAALDRERVKTALYYSLIAQAQLQWRVNDSVSAERTLARCVPAAGQKDRRGWEWHYLQGLFHADLLTLTHDASGPGAAVVYHPRGRWLASVVGGNPAGPGEVGTEVRIWDPETGALLRAFPCPAGVHRLAVRPDGRRLALAAVDGTVLVCDASSGKELLRRRHHEGPVVGIAFSPDRKLLATASWDQTVKLCDAETGAVRHVLRGHGAEVQGLAFHPTAGLLASGGWDQTVRIWDTGTGQQVQTLPGHRSAVYGVAFSPDGRFLASAGSNGNIKVWRFEAAAPAGTAPRVVSGHVVQSLTGHAGSVLSVAFSPDGRYVAYGAGDSSVRFWDVEDGVERITFRGHTGDVEGICFSPDGQRLASVSPAQAAVKVWDLTRHPEHANFARVGPGPDIEALAFRDGDKALVSFTAGGKLQVWNTATGVLLDEHVLAAGGGVISPAVLASFDPGARRLAARDRDNPRHVKVWDVATGAALFTFRDHPFPVCCLRFSGDGRWLAVCAWDSTRPDHPAEIRVWDAHTGLAAVRLDDRGQFFAATFSPDGRWLALGREAGRLTLVDCAAPRPRPRTLAAHRSNVTALAFDPHGQRLASASQGEEAVKVWRLEDLTSQAGDTPEPVESLAASKDLYDLAFTPDGARLAGITRDLVRMWDVAAGQEVLTLRGAPQRHWDPPFNPRLVFSPDGSRLAATNWDESISLWSADDRTGSKDLVASRRVARRRAADQRALFWHLQEAEHCLERNNLSAARFHFQRLRDVPLPGPLQARKQRLAALLPPPKQDTAAP